MAFYPFPVHQRETGEATILRRLCWPDELDFVVDHLPSLILLAVYESVALWKWLLLLNPEILRLPQAHAGARRRRSPVAPPPYPRHRIAILQRYDYGLTQLRRNV
jgi:hypothetical protein